MRLSVIVTGCVVASVTFANAFQQSAPQQAPTFRSGATLVPIDVKVLDKQMRPVTDLKAEDFTILEDGVPQKLQHFQLQMLAAEPTAAVGPLVRSVTVDGPIANQTKRVFLLVLGRGRLQGPSKGVDASIDFVRNRLLPQDMVAVSAWNRATDFTNDHAQILNVLNEFKKQHEALEAKLASLFMGLAAVYGNPYDLGPVQKDIDAIFKPAGSNVRAATAAEGTTTQKAISNEARRQNDPSLKDAEAALLAARPPESRAGLNLPPDLEAESRKRFEIPPDMTFDEFSSRSAATMQDVGRILSGIEYLRGVEGEKHLVFVTAGGLYLPSADNDRSIAAFASDARVIVDTIQTGGIPPPSDVVPAQIGLTAPVTRPTAIVVAPTFSQSMAVVTLRTISELTGGRASMYAYAKDAYDDLDRSTRAGYQLGYYPTNQKWDGKYRRITVAVNRKDVTVSFRHGYYASSERGFDRRGALAYTRVATALGRFVDVDDVPFTVSINASSGNVQQLLVTVSVPPAALALAPNRGQRSASLDVAIFCADSKEQTVGESWETIQVNIPEADFPRLTRQRQASYTARIAVTARVKFVRVAVYDRLADRVGTKMLTIQER